MPPGAVHPENMRDTFAALRMHPAEVSEAAILPWIPRAAEIDQEKDKRLQSFAKIEIAWQINAQARPSVVGFPINFELQSKITVGDIQPLTTLPSAQIAHPGSGH